MPQVGLILFGDN